MSESVPDVTDYDVGKVLIRSTACVVVSRKTKQIVWSSPKAERLFNEPIVNGLNLQSYDILMPEKFRADHEKNWDRFWKAPEPMVMADRVLPCRKKDATEFTAVLWLIPANFEGQECCLVIFTEVSDGPRGQRRTE